MFLNYHWLKSNRIDVFYVILIEIFVSFRSYLRNETLSWPYPDFLVLLWQNDKLYKLIVSKRNMNTNPTMSYFTSCTIRKFFYRRPLKRHIGFSMFNAKIFYIHCVACAPLLDKYLCDVYSAKWRMNNGRWRCIYINK